MNYLSVENPMSRPDGTFLCSVIFDGFDGPIEFIASADDVEGHGREIHARCLAGDFGEIAAYVQPPPPVPASVTRRQMKLALLQMGLLDAVENAVVAANDRALQISWADALDFQRDHAFVLQMAALLGKSPAEVDALFLLAGGV